MDPRERLAAAAVRGVVELGPNRWLVTEPRTTERLLACPSARTTRVDPGTAETSWGPDGLATWTAVRRAMRPLLSATRVAQTVPDMAEHVRRVVTAWPTVIDPMRESVRLVSEIATAHLLGRPAPALSALAERELSLAARPRLLRARLGAARRATFAAVRGHLEADTGLPALLAEHGFDDHTRALALRTMLLSGHHVPAAALAWALHELSLHPETQRQARAEAAAHGSRITAAVVREALRLHPPIWRVERRLDAAVDGFPRDAVVLFSPYVNQRDPSVFRDPREFRPTRWHREPRPVPGSYLPFALGPRICPGSHLALTLMTVTLGVVVATHHLAPERAPTAPRGALYRPRGARIRLRPLHT